MASSTEVKTRVLKIIVGDDDDDDEEDDMMKRKKAGLNREEASSRGERKRCTSSDYGSILRLIIFPQRTAKTMSFIIYYSHKIRTLETTATTVRERTMSKSLANSYNFHRKGLNFLNFLQSLLF